MIQKPDKRKTADIVFFLLLAAGILLLLDRIRYGYHYTDEPFYLCTAYRMMQGDCLLVDDGTVQLYSIVLYPLLRLYYSFVPTGEGVIIAFRYVFLILQIIMALTVYFRMRNVNAIAAIGFAMLIMIQAPYNYAAVSYYTLGINMMCLCCIFTAYVKRKSDYFLAGLFLAIAVLCNPYLLAFYVIYAAAIIIGKLTKKPLCAQLEWKSFLIFSCGAALMAVIFFVYLFINTTPKELLKALPNYVSNDSYSVGREFSKSMSFFSGLADEKRGYYIAAAAAAVLLVLNRYSGWFSERKWVSVSVIAIVYLAQMTVSYRYFRYEESINSFIIIPALIAYTVCEKRDTKAMYFVFLPGFVCGWVYFLGSNTGVERFGTGSVISAGIGLVFIVEAVKELWKKEGRGFAGKAAAILLVFAVAVQSGLQVNLRMNGFRPSPDKKYQMYCTIPYGIAKGEIMSESCYEYEFNLIEREAMPVRQAQGEYVLYFANYPHLYLSDTKKCAAKSPFTSYFWTADKEAEEILRYWERHPEKKPDAIFVSKDGKNVEKAVEMLNTESFDVTETENAYIMLRPEK